MSAENRPEITRPTSSETIFPERFPSITPAVYQTENGTLYLKESGAILVSAPAVNVAGMREFLDGYPSEYGFSQYLDDSITLTSAETLSKLAGQVCYASYGPKRTQNKNADRYIENILSSGHGSVLEHANYSLLVYGVSRACTHEMIRHRAGFGYSQLSQRYVSGNVLRFVERMEYQNDPELHSLFEGRIDRAKKEYEELSEMLLVRQIAGDVTLDAETKTDRRKRVQQTTRSLLPNETETVILVTGNVRAWRHALNMRVNEHAETEIRTAMYNAYLVLNQVAPILFADFKVEDLPDGTKVLKTPYPKV